MLLGILVIQRANQANDANAYISSLWSGAGHCGKDKYQIAVERNLIVCLSHKDSKYLLPSLSNLPQCLVQLGCGHNNVLSA
jgi:hypothetical protein